MRILFEFTKGSRIRFVSHLDMQRFMQRALRRSGLPVRYSQGFNPHTVMSFASALSVGTCSNAEILDVKMEEPVDVDTAVSKMNDALPPDIRITYARLVEDNHNTLQSLIEEASYDLIFYDASFEVIKVAIDAILERTNIVVLRKTKSGEKDADIRPMIINLECKQVAQGVLIKAQVCAAEKTNLKPELLINVISEHADLKDPNVLILRTGIYGKRGEHLLKLIDI